eukprot:263979-Prorocentrum_minimum.AAC.2
MADSWRSMRNDMMRLGLQPLGDWRQLSRCRPPHAVAAQSQSQSQSQSRRQMSRCRPPHAVAVQSQSVTVTAPDVQVPPATRSRSTVTVTVTVTAPYVLVTPPTRSRSTVAVTVTVTAPAVQVPPATRCSTLAVVRRGRLSGYARVGIARSGAHGVMAALTMCDSVSLYGFSSYHEPGEGKLPGGNEDKGNVGWAWHDWAGAPPQTPTLRAFVRL